MSEANALPPVVRANAAALATMIGLCRQAIADYGAQPDAIPIKLAFQAVIWRTVWTKMPHSTAAEIADLTFNIADLLIATRRRA